MDGISCIAPKHENDTLNGVSGSYGAVQLIHFKRTKPQGLAEITIKDLKETYTPTETVIPSLCDLLGFYGKSRAIPGI